MSSSTTTTTTPSTRLVAIIGGTGAQGIPVVRDLVRSGLYTVRVLTRDATNPRFRELQSFGPAGSVEAVEGSLASEETLQTLFGGAWGAFVNIDGFNTGEKTEVFWAMRSYELAAAAGVRMFVYANLDYLSKLSGYDARFRAGHYDGKGRVGEWILHTSRDKALNGGMETALFTTGPYIEMAIGKNTVFPVSIVDGAAVWRAPAGEDGAAPLVALDDCGVYVRWLFDRCGGGKGGSDGMDLQVAIDHVTFADLAAAFAKVTGRPARYENVSLDEYFGGKPGEEDPAAAVLYVADRPAGYNADPEDPATMSFRRNFSGFWTAWQNSGANRGVVRRDYELLDRIHPARIRSAEEFFRRENERGIRLGLGTLWERVQPDRLAHVLKVTEDERQGRL